VVDFLLVLIELFCKLSRLRRYKQILVEVVVFERAWVTLSANIRGKGGLPPTTFGVKKTRVSGLSRGVVCVILHLAVLIQYCRVTHRHTHRHTMLAITRASLALRGLNETSFMNFLLLVTISRKMSMCCYRRRSDGRRAAVDWTTVVVHICSQPLYHQLYRVSVHHRDHRS